MWMYAMLTSELAECCKCHDEVHPLSVRWSSEYCYNSQLLIFLNLILRLDLVIFFEIKVVLMPRDTSMQLFKRLESFIISTLHDEPKAVVSVLRYIRLSHHCHAYHLGENGIQNDANNMPHAGTNCMPSNTLQAALPCIK